MSPSISSLLAAARGRALSAPLGGERAFAPSRAGVLRAIYLWLRI